MLFNKHDKKHTRPALVVTAIISVVVGIGGGVGINKYFNFQDTATLFKIHPLNNDFKFINPLVDIGYRLTLGQEFPEYIPLKKEIGTVIDNEIKSDGVKEVSVYFRSLESGHWLGINPDEKFNPASLFKIPIMIAYLKKAESDPVIFDEKVYFEPSQAGLTVEEKKDLLISSFKPGNYYAVKDLLRKMIVNSDNVAKNLLLYLIDHNSLGLDNKYFESVYNDLGVKFNDPNSSSSDSISPRTYSLFLRALYNSTFLSNDMSELALRWLSESEFKDGLVAGVPSNISVAHKFGEYVKYSGDSVLNVELHDCGIIYYPQNPYVLCVMTKGNDLNHLEAIIKAVSHVIYGSVSISVK